MEIKAFNKLIRSLLKDNCYRYRKIMLQMLKIELTIHRNITEFLKQNIVVEI